MDLFKVITEYQGGVDRDENYVEVYNKVHKILRHKASKYYLRADQIEDFITDSVLTALNKFKGEDEKGFMAFIGKVFDNAIKTHIAYINRDMRKGESATEYDSDLYKYSQDFDEIKCNPISIFKGMVEGINLSKTERKFLDLLFQRMDLDLVRNEIGSSLAYFHITRIREKLKARGIKIDACLI